MLMLISFASGLKHKAEFLAHREAQEAGLPVGPQPLPPHRSIRAPSGAPPAPPTQAPPVQAPPVQAPPAHAPPAHVSAVQPWVPYRPFWPPASTPSAREFAAATALALGVLACLWSMRSRKPEVLVADEAGARGLCALQALGAIVSLALGDASLLPVVLFADTAAHTALLLRTLLGFLEARHATAALNYRRQQIIWSVWLDMGAHLPTVVACVAWLASALSTLLFALVAMTGWALWPWARWGFNAVLSCFVLVIALLSRPEYAHRSASPRVLLAAVLGAGLAHGGAAGGGLGALAPALLLLDALCGARLAKPTEEPARAAAAEPRDPVMRQLLATVNGTQDTAEFEAHLAHERRGCALYCYQDLCAAEREPESMRDKYRALTTQFLAPDAPFPVRGLEPGGPEEVVCVAAAVQKMKQDILVQLRSPYVRFLARARKSLNPKQALPVVCAFMHKPAVV